MITSILEPSLGHVPDNAKEKVPSTCSTYLVALLPLPTCLFMCSVGSLRIANYFLRFPG